MRIGIVADIHEHIDELRRILKTLGKIGVDVVVNLGDACDSFGAWGRAAEVVQLLQAANAVGVWGNHDFGLCREVSEKVRQQSAPEVLAYMATMQARLTIGDCHFSHVEPWLDPHSVEQLWYFEESPNTPEKLRRSFEAVSQRRLFIGHFHRRRVYDSRGEVDWTGEKPLELNGAERYLIIAPPAFSGACLIYDSDADELHAVES